MLNNQENSKELASQKKSPLSAITETRNVMQAISPTAQIIKLALQLSIIAHLIRVGALHTYITSMRFLEPGSRLSDLWWTNQLHLLLACHCPGPPRPGRRECGGVAAGGREGRPGLVSCYCSPEPGAAQDPRLAVDN